LGSHGGEFLLPDEGGEVKIGRLPDLWITLVDAKVSREHCRIFRQSTGWVVEDLGSRNGTYVNTGRIKKRLLQPGDKLRVGQTEFDYGTEAAPPSPGAIIPPLRSTKKR
jgi:pSer/pThr/pTyr-binding forkhead associated (FHA) protein